MFVPGDPASAIAHGFVQPQIEIDLGPSFTVDFNLRA
jgi:hypothetical protein